MTNKKNIYPSGVFKFIIMVTLFLTTITVEAKKRPHQPHGLTEQSWTHGLQTKQRSIRKHSADSIWLLTTA